MMFTFDRIKFVFRALKCVIFILCVAGFFYQITDFGLKFYSYPTIIDAYVKELESFMEPAITVCNHNLLKRSIYCEKFPDDCEKPKDPKQFCEKRPHICRSRNISASLILKSGVLERGGILNKLDDKHSFRVMSFWSGYKRAQSFFQVLGDKIWSYTNHYKLLPCVVLNSVVGKKEKPKFTKFKPDSDFQTPFSNVMWLDLDVAEMLNPDENPYALVEIHSPFEPAPSVNKGLILKPDKSYTITISLEEHHFLPSPYKTDCIDYEEIWEKNNKTGPRSQKECRRHCISIEYEACWNCSFDFMEKLKNKCFHARTDKYLCNDTEKQKVKEQEKFCYSQCKKECIKRIYHLSLIEMPRSIELIEYPDIIKVVFQINDPVVYIYEHRPQYASVEFYSAIGGFIGVWLGISAWSSMNVLINLLSSLRKKIDKHSYNSYNI